MSQLLLVSTDLRKTNRSATFRVQKGDYRFECSEVDLEFKLILGDKVNPDGNGVHCYIFTKKHGDLVTIPNTLDMYLEMPQSDKTVTVVLGDL